MRLLQLLPHPVHRRHHSVQPLLNLRGALGLLRDGNSTAQQQNQHNHSGHSPHPPIYLICLIYTIYLIYTLIHAPTHRATPLFDLR